MGLAKDIPRFDLARRFGANHTVNVEEEEPADAVSRITGGAMADLVIEWSGAPAAINAAIDMLRPGGRLVLVGTNARAVSITTDLVVRKEIEIAGGLGQTFEVEKAVKLQNARKYPVEELTARVFPLAEAEKAMRFALENPQCIRVGLEP